MSVTLAYSKEGGASMELQPTNSSLYWPKERISIDKALLWKGTFNQYDNRDF